MIINDILSSDDKHVMMVSESDTNIPFFDLSNLESLSYTLSNRDKHFFECLAWLIKMRELKLKSFHLKKVMAYHMPNVAFLVMA